MVAIKRAQINRNTKGVDITVMSSKYQAKAFAPTWELVMGHKSGAFDENAYAMAYGALLNLIPTETWTWLAAQAGNDDDTVTLLCYCKNATFCHTHLVALYAEHVLPETFVCSTEPPSSVTQTQWYLELSTSN